MHNMYAVSQLNISTISQIPTLHYDRRWMKDVVFIVPTYWLCLYLFVHHSLYVFLQLTS